MIERYFAQGIRLKWTSPGDLTGGTKDGSIINNRGRPTTPMVCDGLDPSLYLSTSPHLQQLGLAKGTPFPYIWLSYAPGHTTKNPLAGQDILTGYMSGCLITLWTEGGLRYVGHVGTDKADPTASARTKQTFAGAMPQNTTGFDPDAAWDAPTMRGLQLKFPPIRPVQRILGLVTTTGQFYSVLLFDLLRGDWCVGGCKSVTPMDYNQLSARMQ